MHILLALVASTIVVGPALASYWLIPREVLTAWPVFALSLLPTGLSIITSLVFRGYWPLLDAPLAKSAAEWLRGRLDLRTKVGILVAAMERDSSRGSFFHPPSRTIVLANDVHGEHTVRAYATAAHELGHAFFQADHPTWASVMTFARVHARYVFQSGVGLLLGATLVGTRSLAIVAVAMFGLAAVLQALVVADEAIATMIAARELQGDLRDRGQRAIARAHLRRALATYVSLLVAYATPLVASPSLINVGDGVLVDAPALTGVAAVAASIIAVVCVVGALAGLRPILRGRKTGRIGVVSFLLAVMWAPLMTTLLCNRPGLPPWTVALAVLQATLILSLPLGLVVRWLAGFVSRDLERMALPLSIPQGLSIDRVSFAKLAKAEQDEGRLERLATHLFVLWAVPLAVAWLLS